MTDKQYKEQKARMKKLINKWVAPLGLNWWKLQYEWIRSDHDGGETTYMPFTGKDQKFTCIMSVVTDYYYKTATIQFYLLTLMDYSDEELERHFVHECMHIHLKAMQTKQKAAEEELVATSLADAFIWVRDAGSKDAKTK